MTADALYVDASAMVKTFVDEAGADEATEAIVSASAVIANRLLYTEVGRALTRRLADGDLDPAMAEWDRVWGNFRVVEVDQQLAVHGLALAAHHDLGTLDAIHLASALRIPAVPIRFATWDRALWDAARGVGLRTVPEDRP